MPLLLAEANRLSQNDLVRGVVEEFIRHDPIFGLLPFTGTMGKSYDYVREKTLAQGNWLDPNDTVQESASDFTEVSTRLRILIGDVDVDKFLDGTLSDKNSQKAIQIASKVKGMSNQFRDALINGLQANKEFDGLEELCVAGQSLTTTTALDMKMLDELLDSVKLGADVIIMHPILIRQYRQLLRAFGGNTGGMMEIPNYGLPVLAHEGVPILPNDFINPFDIGGSVWTSTAYAVHFDEANGVHGLFAKNHPVGFDLEAMGTVADKDATRTRIKLYTGMAMKATHSLSKLSGILH